MRVSKLLTLALWAALGCFFVAARAQDETPADSDPAEPAAEQPQSEEEAPSPEDTPAESSNDAEAEQQEAASDEPLDFDTLFAEWKELLTRLREIQAEFQVAPEDEKPALESEFNELLEKGEQMAPKVARAAEERYAEDPSSEGDVADFLASMVRTYTGRDMYDDALRVSNLLIENGYDNKAIYNFAGIAAFSMDEFEQAKQFFAEAEAAEALDDQGRSLAGEVDQYIDLWQREQEFRAAEAEADDLPRVSMETSEGEIVIELYEDQAPNTVANFVSLVEKGFYDGLAFHRVLPGFMAQGGDPLGNGTGGPGYVIACECYDENARDHFRGTLSMAHAGKDTGGSQFFITFRPTPHLNRKHTVFGRVIEGLDVLERLQRRSPGAQDAPEPSKIVEATVVRKRDHEYEPETLPEQ